MAEEKFNVDELVPPSFITESYIVDVLRTVEDDPDLHVINYEIRPGSKAGDHYASVMFKIIVTYGSRGKIESERSFILKTIPEAEGPKKELLENLPAFKNEISMYTKILPDMEAILKEHGEKGWWPKLVYSQVKPFVLMFDDLTVEKYEVVNDPLNFEQLKMVVDKIAKYHALSLVLIERGHKELEEHKMVFPEEMKQMFGTMVTIALQLASYVKTWPGYEDLGAKIESFCPKMADKMFKLLTHDFTKYFRVLNHGDFHIRNLMFKRNSQGEPSEVIFLDFQMPNYNVPAFDFIGLLTTMGDAGVRQKENEVVKYYHRELLASLERFGFLGETPSVIDIKISLLRLSEQHVFYTLILAPAFALRGFELGALFDPIENKRMLTALEAVFTDPAVVEDLKYNLTRFDSRGIFDD